jgi:hypothetical protein
VPEQVDRPAVDAEQGIEHQLEVAQVLGKEVGVARRRVGRAEAAPVDGDHVALGRQRIDHELERRGHVHPAVQHHQRRPLGRARAGEPHSRRWWERPRA